MKLDVKAGMTVGELNEQAVNLLKATIVVVSGEADFSAATPLKSISGNKVGRGRSVFVTTSTTVQDVTDYFDRWVGLDIQVCSLTGEPLDSAVRMQNWAREQAERQDEPKESPEPTPMSPTEPEDVAEPAEESESDESPEVDPTVPKTAKEVREDASDHERDLHQGRDEDAQSW